MMRLGVRLVRLRLKLVPLPRLVLKHLLVKAQTGNQSQIRIGRAEMPSFFFIWA
jgi:hypothetical protein